MKSHNKPSVAVLGSLNVDLIASVKALPRAGETVAAGTMQKLFGGKGANQAIAVARQSVAVCVIGCVGGDADGRAYRERMKDEGIDVTGISIAKDSLTGTALIGVAADGENLIMVAPEANGCVTPELVRRHRRKIESANVLLVQFEVPENAIIEAIKIANAAGVAVVVNPSPFRNGFPWEQLRTACVIVNESEAKQLTGLNPATMRKQKRKWCDALTRRQISRLIVTRGDKPTWSLDNQGCLLEVPTLAVEPIDTVGAGDAFAGAFAAGMARGERIAEVIAHANCAGALATLKPGAQEAIPNRRQTLAAKKSLK